KARLTCHAKQGRPCSKGPALLRAVNGHPIFPTSEDYWMPDDIMRAKPWFDCALLFYKGIGADAETFAQAGDLPCIEGSASRQNFRHDALAADFGQVGLSQRMLVHQEGKWRARDCS